MYSSCCCCLRLSLVEQRSAEVLCLTADVLPAAAAEAGLLTNDAAPHLHATAGRAGGRVSTHWAVLFCHQNQTLSKSAISTAADILVIVPGA